MRWGARRRPTRAIAFDAAWTPVPIDDSVAWVDGYRGLFGLDAYDRFAGERAPAGPRYNRNGSVRQTWHDPLGWAGLVKVAPPHRAPVVLEERIADVEAEAAALEAELAAAGAELAANDLEVTQALVIALVALAVIILLDNVRELRGR